MSDNVLVPALDIFRTGEILMKSGYFTDIKDASQAVVKILAGAEIGIGPIASLSAVFIQNGKPTYSANVIAAAIKKSKRYDYIVKVLTATQCDLSFFENGKLSGVSTFTMKDAETAGLLNGRNAHSWKHYPKNMLFARALTNGARWYCPDVFGGQAPYSPEEMDVEIDGESGEAITTQAVASPASKPKLTYTQKPEPTLMEQLGDTNPTGAAYISEPQRRRLFAISGKAKVAHETLKIWLGEHYGITSSREITTEMYDGIIEAVESGWVTEVPVTPEMRELLENAHIKPAEFELFIREVYRTTLDQLQPEQQREVERMLNTGYCTQWVMDWRTEQEKTGAA
jgi:hypothetical protein